MDNKYGTLYICATPIGNMGDITLRVLEILKSVEFIAAEDTRRTLKLLNRYDIKKKLISCHEHNEAKRSGELIALLKGGADAAYVTDAGMPAVSDPGSFIVSECVRERISVTVCPGASALLSALVLSGLSSERFVFEGFLPRAAKERCLVLNALKSEVRTLVFYEAPHRLLKTLGDILLCLGDRRIAVARELTKVHEEVLRTNVSGALAEFERRTPKGEFVLVIEGAEETKAENPLNRLNVSEHVSHYKNEGLTEMDAIKKAARDRNVPKREVYEAVKCKM